MNSHRCRALVLFDHKNNRDIACDRLRRQGVEVSDEASGVDGSYDICFIDAPALARLHTQILQVKQSLAPVYFPFLLVGHKDHNAKLLQQYCACIDQMVASPLSDAELQLHINIALRTRRYSVSLKEQVAQVTAKARFSEERYRIVSELTSDYAYGFHIGPDGKCVLEWATDAFEQRTGYTLEEVNRLGWQMLIHPDDMPSLHDRKERLDEGFMDLREFRLLTKTGETLWLLDHALPQTSDGKVSRIYGAMRDITEQKATKTALQASEHKFAEIARLVPVAIYQTDPNGDLIYMNERWSHFTGLSLERAYGQEWKKALHPDDVALFDEWQNKAKRGEKFSAEFRYLKPDGSIVWAYTLAEPQWTDDRNPAGYIGTTTDITARKQAEEALRQSERRLRRILETLPIGVWLMDAAGNIVHGNEAGRKIWAGTNYTGGEQFDRDYNAWWLASGKKIEKEDWAGLRAIRKGETSINEEVEIECFDGTRKIILNSAVPLYDNRQNIVGAIFVNQDIGERKLAEEESHTHAEILANMAEGVIVTDEAGIIFFTNMAMQRMYGYASQDLLGMHAALLKAAPVEEARWMVASTMAILKERGHWSGEYESRRKNGETFTVAARISRIIITGKPYIVSVQQDITELKKAEEVRLRLAAIVQSSDDAIIGNALDGTILSWNPGAEKMYGYKSNEICGKSISVLMPPERENDFAEIAERLSRGQAVKNFETRRARKDGTVLDVSLTLSPIKDLTGKIIGVAKIARDITERKKAEENLRLWGRAIEASSNGIMIVDVTAPEQPIVYANPAFQQITGYTPDEVKGRNARLLQGPNRDQTGIHEIRTALREQREGHAVLCNYRKDGQLFWNELSVAPVREADGRVTYFIGILNDITERTYYEAELEYQATHDALTRLPNRTLLLDRLQQAVMHAQRSQAMAAVLFIDLDRFKVVNDSISHDAGDQLLRGVAGRLRSLFRVGDTVARQGGDEFVVVLEHIDNEREAAELAQRVLQAMITPFPIERQQFYATCSIGIAIYPKDGTQASDLLKNADAAMYRAKEEGRNTFRFYASEMNARALQRFELEAAMRGAIERHEFLLHYQPQVELSTGRLIGFEALVRWQHPQLGLLCPSAFIDLAEESGLIVPIGEWVLREACRQAKWWQAQALGEYCVAVNLSARQFSDGNLTQLVDSALRDTGLEAKYLELEITESLLMENPEAAADTLRRLRARGVRLSLDDFGTGYSSLGYLKRFSLDKLKIDYSFVRDITNDPDSAAIATAIIAMAHRLKLKVVAEGVETEGQLGYLKSHRCDQVQGYLFSPPIPAEACTQLLQTTSRFDLPFEGEDHRRTLLIVDDEVNILHSLRRLLRHEGYRILTAGNAGEGFEILARNNVDVIISDQRMPEMSGTEFLNRVRDLHPATVRIVLSGYTDLDSVTDAINKGAIYKFLTKPWDDDLLRANIAEAFRWRDLNTDKSNDARDSMPAEREKKNG